MGEIKDIILELPQVSIDHLGLTKEGFEDLKDLVRNGVYVKATGFGRIEVDPLQTLKALMEINSNAIMFGTDLPSTRAKRPFEKSDIELIEKNFSKEEQEKIFYKNAMHFYRIKVVIIDFFFLYSIFLMIREAIVQTIIKIINVVII